MGASAAWIASSGPFTFSTNDETGTLIDGFGSPPVILMTYNQPYVPQFIEAAGFRKAMDLGPGSPI